MTLRQTLLGSFLAAIALSPIGAYAQSYYVYRAPTIVSEPAPQAETRVTRYWDSDRGVWIEQRVVEEPRPMHWVPERRIVEPDGSIYIENGHWEYDR